MPTDFVKSCIRDPRQKYVDMNYIQNIKEGIKFFGKWFDGITSIRDYNIRTLLTIQHSIIVNDEYKGYTNPVNKIPKSVIRDEKRIKLYKPTLKKEWYAQELKNYNLKVGQKRIIKIKNIALKRCHSIKVTDKDLKLYLPNNRHVKYYIYEMSTIMNILRDGNYNSRSILGLLGHYIQLGVICHPFEKVNFSLIMSQVNYILKYYGYKPISHGYLDFECFLKTTDEVIKSFKKKVKSRLYNTRNGG